jgi:hypothetical protein
MTSWATLGVCSLKKPSFRLIFCRFRASLVLNMWPYSYMAKISFHCFQPFGIFSLCEGNNGSLGRWIEFTIWFGKGLCLHLNIFRYKKSMVTTREQERHKHDVFSGDLKDRSIAWLYHMPWETWV